MKKERKLNLIVFQNNEKHNLEISSSLATEGISDYVQQLYPEYTSYVYGNQLNSVSKKYDRGGVVQLSNDSVRKASSEDKQGGMVVGKRHAECDETGCGEKFEIENQGRQVELEAKEAVLCAEAMSSQEKFDFGGEQKTGKEIVSFLNVKGGGVSFSSGDKIDVKPAKEGKPSSKPILDSQAVTNLVGGESILTVKTMDSNDKYEFNGKLMTPREIASFINVNSGGKKFAKGGNVAEVSENKPNGNSTNNIADNSKKFEEGGEIEDEDEIEDLSNVQELDLGDSVDLDEDVKIEPKNKTILKKDVHLLTLDEFLKSPPPIIVFEGNKNTFIYEEVNGVQQYKSNLFPITAVNMYNAIVREAVDRGKYTKDIMNGIIKVEEAFTLIKGAHIAINDELKQIMNSVKVNAHFDTDVKLTKMIYFVNKLLAATGYKERWIPKLGESIIYLKKGLRGLVSDNNKSNGKYEIMLYNKLNLVTQVVDVDTNMIIPYIKKDGQNYIDYTCEENDYPNYFIQVIKNKGILFETYIKNKNLIPSAINKVKDKLGNGDLQYKYYYSDGKKIVLQDTINL